MDLNPHIFRAYDIRGIAQPLNPADKADLTEQTVRAIGQGTGTWLKRNRGAKNMVVGRDNRLTSESLQKAFIDGVLSTGIDVTDIGLSTSPLLYYAVCKNGFDSGVSITASHNPKEYNGVKIVEKEAHSVCGKELQEILLLIQAEDFEKAQAPGKLSVKEDNFENYVKDIQSRIKLERPLKVVVDAGNGVTGKFAPQLLRALGCEVTELFCELDGNYPNHEANPEDEKNTRDMAKLVVEQKAHLGIGFDGDGDRVGIVDEAGKHYSADWFLILLAQEMLAKNTGEKVLFDVKASKILIDEIEKNGGEPVMSKTGHSFIETKMHQLNAPLAGEISGHLFFGKKHYNWFGFDDAFFGACKILEIISREDKPFSSYFQSLRAMYTTPEYKAHCPDNRKFKIVEEVSAHFQKEYDCITIDGVRINFDDQSWGAVRCSNTSPNLTLRFEASTPEKLEEIKGIMARELEKHPEVDMSWYQQKSE